jgi:hypothetical protein
MYTVVYTVYHAVYWKIMSMICAMQLSIYITNEHSQYYVVNHHYYNNYMHSQILYPIAAIQEHTNE